MYSKFIKKRQRARRTHYGKRFSAPFRLCVFRSNCHFYAQLIDDSNANTVFALSTLSRNFSGVKNRKLNKDVVSSLGEFFVSNIPEDYKGVKVVFDKSCYKYHGLVMIFAEKVRKVLSF